MRRLPVFILALFVGLSVVGCDSNEDDPSDAELLVGTWAMVNITDATGDKTAGFAELTDGVTASFTTQNAFTILVNYKESVPRPDQTVPGTYTLDAGAKALVLATAGGGPSLAFTYSFVNDNQLRLSADAAFINALFQPVTPYQGQVTITIQRTA